MHKLDSLNVCAGHPDEHFIRMAKAKNNKFLSSTGEVSAFLDNSGMYHLNGKIYTETLRSSKCHLLVQGTKCPDCVSYRSTLRATYNRWFKQKAQSSVIHSHTNDRWLTSPQKRQKTLSIISKLKECQKRIAYLEQKINESHNNLSIEVDEALHNGLEKIMNEYATAIQNKYREDSFHRLFWDEQVKNLHKYPSQRRW